MIVQAAYLIGQRSSVDHIIRLAALKFRICGLEALDISACRHTGGLLGSCSGFMSKRWSTLARTAYM